MPHRYFTTEISDGTATLRGADAHHLARVMRARLGDTVILCDGNAVEYTATITGFGDECVEFSVEPGYPSAAEPSVEVTLLAGYPQAGQTGTDHQARRGAGRSPYRALLQPVLRGGPKKEEQKNERYNRIAVEAAKQCGRGILPDVALPLANFGAVCRTFDQYDLVLFCYECGGAPSRRLLAETAPADGQKLKIAIVTGAEGGFAAEEAEMAAKAGARTVGLGPRILRCETAPLAVLSAVMTLTGNLNNIYKNKGDCDAVPFFFLSAFQQSLFNVEQVLRADREAAQAQLQILHRVGRVAYRQGRRWSPAHCAPLRHPSP